MKMLVGTWILWVCDGGGCRVRVFERRVRGYFLHISAQAFISSGVAPIGRALLAPPHSGNSRMQEHMFDAPYYYSLCSQRIALHGHPFMKGH
jgi:hypothetical protein